MNKPNGKIPSRAGSASSKGRIRTRRKSRQRRRRCKWASKERSLNNADDRGLVAYPKVNTTAQKVDIDAKKFSEGVGLLCPNHI